MGRVARWLELHAEATRLHEQLMPLLTDSLEQSQTSGHAGNTDDGNLLELLARWQQLVGEMDTANLGPQAQALREPIARLARMNQEIGQGARQVRDLGSPPNCGGSNSRIKTFGCTRTSPASAESAAGGRPTKREARRASLFVAILVALTRPGGLNGLS